MPTIKNICLLTMISIACASPITSTPSKLDVLEPRLAPCYPENMPNGIDDYNCPKKATMDSNGHCSSPIPNIPSSATGCSAYCEVKLTKILGQEIPFEEGSCQGGTTCAVASGRSVSITNTYGVNTNVGGSVSGDIGNDISGILKSVINVGASYSYSQTIGYSTIILNSKDLNDTTCGYWTFIPYFINSCGTLTSAAIGETPAGYYFQDESPFCDKKTLSDVGNYCNTMPYQDIYGHGDGKVIFVYTDCGTNIALPNGQDADYWFPGVAISHLKSSTIVFHSD